MLNQSTTAFFSSLSFPKHCPKSHFLNGQKKKSYVGIVRKSWIFLLGFGWFSAVENLFVYKNLITVSASQLVEATIVTDVVVCKRLPNQIKNFKSCTSKALMDVHKVNCCPTCQYFNKRRRPLLFEFASRYYYIWNHGGPTIIRIRGMTRILSIKDSGGSKKLILILLYFVCVSVNIFSTSTLGSIE